MERIFFISDVHLGAHSGKIEKVKIQNLILFLNEIRDKADMLYIVGDLYDFWFEYRTAIPKVNLKVLSNLHQLVESGTEVRYFTGNHDLWQDGYLANEIGVKMYHEPLTVEHNSLKLFIAHGDGLVKSDWQARLRNKIFKNRLNIYLYRLIHPDLGIPLAHWVSGESRALGENRFDAEYRQFALRKLDEDIDAVILGHTHNPIFEKIESKYYINLGEWWTQFKFLELNGSTLELKTWNPGSVKGMKLHKS